MDPRYIDANKINFESVESEYGKRNDIIMACEEIVCNAATEDVKPIIYAYWECIGDVAPVGLHGLHHCSLCGHPSMRAFNISSREVLTPYCPNCGAKMVDKTDIIEDKSCIVID